MQRVLGIEPGSQRAADGLSAEDVARASAHLLAGEANVRATIALLEGGAQRLTHGGILLTDVAVRRMMLEVGILSNLRDEVFESLPPVHASALATAVSLTLLGAHPDAPVPLWLFREDEHGRRVTVR